MKELQELLEKYNRPVPRYTSYPTVPYWQPFDDATRWQQLAREKYYKSKDKGISVYIHLPFCESLCTYCGCNKRITTNHNVEEEYINAVLKEWQLYVDLIGEKPVIRELHLGGGTPTFFTPANLEMLLTGLFDKAVIHPQKEFGFEGHPNNTTLQHLETLNRLGFTRVSYGVQDNDPVVQRAINRLQPFENVRRATENARDAGYTSVNFDLIYGLPFQTLEGQKNTFKQVISLAPDRIAFYSYAHVPWKQKAQRLFDETNLPSPAEKMQLYMQGKNMLAKAGYSDIGMDHFALPHDDLYKAWINNTLHRNFMGYTTTHTNYLLGLGVSAISDIGVAYAQNHKELENYYRGLQRDKLEYSKGYFLSKKDEAIKKYILDIACRNATLVRPQDRALLGDYTMEELNSLQDDGLVNVDWPLLEVTKTGRQFIRNICYAFDSYRQPSGPQNATMFSKAI
ncbi:MAG TPA: oxygen-independent coproporphyrinogen III oxidase [Chitinophagaceae bacterium]|nr:oxygen-independent coproporphyrinogen III oxidase [Chitinophagaceae bacterium]